MKIGLQKGSSSGGGGCCRGCARRRVQSLSTSGQLPASAASKNFSTAGGIAMFCFRPLARASSRRDLANCAAFRATISAAESFAAAPEAEGSRDAFAFGVDECPTTVAVVVDVADVSSARFDGFTRGNNSVTSATNRPPAIRIAAHGTRPGPFSDGSRSSMDVLCYLKDTASVGFVYAKSENLASAGALFRWDSGKFQSRAAA